MVPAPPQFHLAVVVVLSGLVLPGCNSPAQGAPANAARGLAPIHHSPPAIPEDPDNHIISASAIGGVRLGMTLDELRRTLPGATFGRTSDGDGAALVQVTLGKGESLVLWADEESPAAPIAWSKRIKTIETFSPSFHTAEGVHAGSLVIDAQKVFGAVTDIVRSEIESREYVRFEAQPAALTFRVDGTGTTSDATLKPSRIDPGARIYSIAISSF